MEKKAKSFKLNGMTIENVSLKDLTKSEREEYREVLDDIKTGKVSRYLTLEEFDRKLKLKK